MGRVGAQRRIAPTEIVAVERGIQIAEWHTRIGGRAHEGAVEFAGHALGKIDATRLHTEQNGVRKILVAFDQLLTQAANNNFEQRATQDKAFHRVKVGRGRAKVNCCMLRLDFSGQTTHLCPLTGRFFLVFQLMTYHFSKYQGTGNDFVMIDDRPNSGRKETFPQHDQDLIARLCDRRFGIGADGLILLQNHADFDFRMVYFNANGAEGSMCGNGGRCIVRFAHDLGLFTTHTRFMAVDGEHEATVADGLISLRMSNVGQIDTTPAYSFTNTGSPHVVLFVDDLANHDVVGIGQKIRYSDAFAPTGTNVNFMQLEPDGTLFVRTYERGVEGETYSCGTGVTAAALVANRQLGMASPVSIRTLGGELRVAFELVQSGGYEQIGLIGPAQKVFEGHWLIS